jgi:hypothetical protein
MSSRPTLIRSREMLRQGREDGRSALRVVVGGHQAVRLVIEKKPRALALRQRLAVDGDAILGGNVERRRGNDLAVDRDPAGYDPGLGLAPRAQAGPRDRLGDALAAIVAAGRVVHTSGCNEARMLEARAARSLSASVALESDLSFLLLVVFSTENRRPLFRKILQ